MNSDSLNFVAESSQSDMSTEMRMVEAQASTARKAKRIPRPYKTKKGYHANQRHYRQWCDRQFADLPVESRYTVYGEKILLFLRECVVDRPHKKCDSKKIKYGTAMYYLAAINDLYNQQKALRVNSHPHPRAMCIKLIESMRVREENQRRAEFQDCGLGTSTDGCTSEYFEFKRAMEKSVDVESNLAGKIATLSSQVASLQAQMADFSSGRVFFQLVRADQPNVAPVAMPSTTSSAAPTNTEAPSTRSMELSYRMSRGVITIPDLWREWHTGLGGGVSVVEMNLRSENGAWRKNDRHFYYRRRRIIEAISNYAAIHRVQLETAVAIAEENRRVTGKSIDYMSKNVDQIFPDQ